jgi:hypothetical protein
MDIVHLYADWTVRESTRGIAGQHRRTPIPTPEKFSTESTKTTEEDIHMPIPRIILTS